MDFDVTEDRKMLAEALRRLLADAWDPETRARAAYEPPWHLPECWAALGEMGVLAAFVPEEVGGFGGAGHDIVTVFEEVGRTLAPEPLLGALLATRVMAACDDGADDLAAVLDGQRRPVLAFAEPPDLDVVTDIATKATDRDGDWHLSGRKSMVDGGPGADLLVVTARVDDGLGVFAVAAEDAELVDAGRIDGGGTSEVVLDDVPARLLDVDGDDAVAAALDAGRLALCAEAVGAMDHLVGLTSGYLSERRQFGRPLASFQALQHRVVDLAIELEQARSITILAASSLDTPDRRRHVAMAKHKVGRVARLVAEEAIQLHGGIGMTWEYQGSHYAKRLVMLDAQLGDADRMLEEVMATAPSDET